MKDWKKSLAMVSALAVVITATSSLSLTANAVTNEKYEFEDGTLVGAKSMSEDKDGNEVAHSGSGFIFLQDGGETATVNITVEKTGMYNVTVSAYAPYGDKIHNLLINGVDQGQISFTENSEFTEVNLGMFKLQEGENEVTVKSSWGWTYFDYVSISEAEFPSLNVEKSLCDKDATDETKRLMSFLVDTYGNGVLSGQQEIYMYGPHDFEWEFEYLKDLTGFYPAIRGFDYLNEVNILYGSEDGTTDRMIDWAKNKNGIVTASWHVTVPCDFENYEMGVTHVDWGNATYDPKKTDFDTAKVLEEGSKENEYYMACLEKLAESIGKLQDAGVPLIFRPLHEAEGSGGETGSWFWWGKSGSAVYKDLWKLTYETLTETYGLHNIIWEWNSYAYSTSKDWYPGDEYVDIVAYDKYNCTDWSSGSPVLNHNDSAISGTFYNLVDMYGGKKMVAMAENDCVPTLENMTSEKAGWLYFCPWYDGGSDDTNFLTNPVFNKSEDLVEMYQSDYCVNLEEIPEDLYNTYSLDGFGEITPPEVIVTTSSTEIPGLLTGIDGKVLEVTDDTITVGEFTGGFYYSYDPITIKISDLGDFYDANDPIQVGDVVNMTTIGMDATEFSQFTYTHAGDVTTAISTTIDPDITTTKDPNVTTTTTIGDSSVVLGDANGDGQVRNNDVQLIRQSILHLIDEFEEGSQAFINSDVTKDGNIRNNDVQLIRQYILKLIDSLDDLDGDSPNIPQPQQTILVSY